MANKAPAKVSPLDEVNKTLITMEERFQAVLPKHISTDKFNAVVITALRNKPDLLQLNRQSLYNACLDCAQDGLLPNGIESAFIPFKGMVKYSPMVTGITKKARNSGEIKTIDAQVVYSNDEYDSWTDENGPHFRHKRAVGDRGTSILTYAYAITRDGGVYIEEIDEKQMEAIEKCCNAKQTPWKGPFRDEMKRKSALRRLCKYRLPSSTDMDIIRRDDELYDLDGGGEGGEQGNEQAPVASNLEKAVTGGEQQQVEDAEFTPAPEQPQQEAPKQEAPKKEAPAKKAGKRWNVQGKVEALTLKNGNTNGKAWTKYGCKIHDKWYGTFSDTAYVKMREAKDNDLFVEFTCDEKQIENRTIYDIENDTFNVCWPDDGPTEAKATPVSEDEIPI